MTGAPTTTPKAYAEMMWPVVAFDRSMPTAISSSRPIVMNSVVPIANPPSARASSAAPTCVGRTSRLGALVIVSVTTPSSTPEGPEHSALRENRDVRLITDDERRARLGRRHALAEQVPTAEDAARAVVALHGTDPATTILSAVQRSGAGIDDVQRALYDDRSLVRVLAMRRTVFAVPRDLVTSCWSGAADTVASEQRRRLARMLVASDVTDDPDQWIDRATTIALKQFGSRVDVTSGDLTESDPMLATRVQVGSGDWTASNTVASRLLTVLSAAGDVVRARPRGSWTSTQFRWATADAWCGDLGERPAADRAAAELARPLAARLRASARGRRAVVVRLDQDPHPRRAGGSSTWWRSR